MTKVSIIMNCFNGEKYMKEAIDSIYNQTFDDWEIIFWDNCSTDSSPLIAQSYDHRLQYFRGTEVIPLGAARKLAVMKAKGEWIAFLDTDDYWFPNKLATQLAAVEKKDYVMCYAGIREITANGKKIREILPIHKSGWMLEDQLIQFDINMVTPLISSLALAKYSLNFDEKITASEEYNLFVRIAAKGKIFAIPEALGAYRVHSGSLTDRQKSQWAEERFYTLRQLCDENEELCKKYSKAIDVAYKRGVYYKACYLMSEKDECGARELLSELRGNNFKYFLLYILSFSPLLWRYAHDRYIKIILTKLFRI